MTFRGLTQLTHLSSEAQATEWRSRVLNIRELLKSQCPPLRSTVASADSKEKMNLGPMDFPESHGRGGRESEKWEQRSLQWSFPLLPVQKLRQRKEPGASPTV